jgi:ABC-type uncharacterized transport system permease subunit
VDVVRRVADQSLQSHRVKVGYEEWLTGRQEPGSTAMNAVLLLAAYPADIFTGAGKALLYTVLPAAFIAAVPARFIDAPTMVDAGWMLFATAVFVLLAVVTFSLGLRRYASGSAWGRG